MEQGLELFVSGEANSAAEHFDAGYAKYSYSAFLFNAGVCYEKMGRPADALARFNKYLEVDPGAPDQADVRKRIANLTAQLGGAAPAPGSGVDRQSIRSLLVLETEPVGAPVVVYRPNIEGAAPFVEEGQNPQWTRVQETVSPANLSLSVGKYHVMVEKTKGFKEFHVDVNIDAGHVYNYMVHLPQGKLMGFLRVTSNVRGAHIWLDKPIGDGPEWGTAPYGELVVAGERTINVDAPGFEPQSAKVSLDPSEPLEIQVDLQRVGYGFLRIDGTDSPEIQVALDGKPQGRWPQGAPGLKIQASSGRHLLRVEADGRKTFEGMIDVPRGQVLPVHVRMIPKYPRGAAWGQAAISAGLFGGGIYLGLESERIKDELDADRRGGRLDGADMRIAKGRWFAVGADAAFAGGVVLAGLSTWNFIKDPLPESSAEFDEAVEFEDPRSKRPTASLRPAGASGALAGRAPLPVQQPVVPEQVLTISPAASDAFAGILIGGTF